MSHLFCEKSLKISIVSEFLFFIFRFRDIYLDYFIPPFDCYITFIIKPLLSVSDNLFVLFYIRFCNKFLKNYYLRQKVLKR